MVRLWSDCGHITVILIVPACYGQIVVILWSDYGQIAVIMVRTACYGQIITRLWAAPAGAGYMLPVRGSTPGYAVTRIADSVAHTIVPASHGSRHTVFESLAVLTKLVQ